jgi:hypothetical protein
MGIWGPSPSTVTTIIIRGGYIVGALMENAQSQETLKEKLGTEPDREVQFTAKFNSAEYERWSYSLRSRRSAHGDDRAAS